MPSLKDLKTRIASVKSTQKITKAMKMVAASKLRRAEQAANSSRPYAQKMASMLSSLAAGMDNSGEAPRLLFGTGKDQVHLLVVATAERGLCGGFNASIVKAARQSIKNLLAAGKQVKIITVGKKGRGLLKSQYADKIIDHVDLSAVKQVGFDNAKAIGLDLTRRFEAGEFDVCTVFFAEFVSVMSQLAKGQQLIPMQLDDADTTEPSSHGQAFYEFEPDEGAILTDLLPRNLNMQVYKALLENAASEQGARMAAMDSATRNAGEMIDKLTLVYNRTRQATITKELIEIISGAEAV